MIYNQQSTTVMKRALVFLSLTVAATYAQEGWWMTEPIRWVQTNLREVDAGLDTRRLATQLADMRANVLLMGMGGICAYYPTKTEFHYPSAYLPAGRDMFGDILREAHARGIRVVGRFDFSKTPKAVFDAHPEWFFKKADGGPVVYNGLYSTCINGGYYRGQAMKILTEALEKYDVDGLFFNMFGNQSSDYSGNYVGLCHCDSCKEKFRRMYSRDIPDKPDADYARFLAASSREVSEAVGELIRAKRPKAGYFNYLLELTDGVMSESNTAVGRSLPLWPYSASDNVNRARNSAPDKMAINLNMQFVDYWWRFATVPRGEIALRMWQNLAHGGALTFEVNGTLDLQDRQALETAKPVFRWAADNEQYYVRQRSAARVLLLGANPRGMRDNTAYRGVFRLLSEEHIPFAVSHNLDWIGKRQFDLVIAVDSTPAAFEPYVANGGRVLIISSRAPEFPVVQVKGTSPELRGYIRVRNHSMFPSLQQTDLLMLNGPFTELEGDGSDSLTLVPPSMIGPPEKVHVDIKDTTTPAIVTKNIGKGSVTWIPWELGSLYYRHSLVAHAGLFRDVVDRLLPERQLKTNAHPLVETTLIERDTETMVHLVNLSGHSQTAYFPPVPMKDIRVEVLGSFTRARTVRKPIDVPVRKRGKYSELTIPELSDYEMVVLN
jgi:hypothetical protein